MGLELYLFKNIVFSFSLYTDQLQIQDIQW